MRVTDPLPPTRFFPIFCTTRESNRSPEANFPLPKRSPSVTLLHVTSNSGGRRWRALDRFLETNARTEHDLVGERLRSLVARSIVARLYL